MKHLTLFIAIVCFILPALHAQENPSGIADSTIILQEAVLEGYEYDRPLQLIPAAIGTLNQHDLQRFSNTSLVPAMNTIAGVYMEERSPGSYRLSIRGSSLRSPFGIRNVKVYWNGLPFTDAGGNTYLNLFDFNQIDGMEVIKGPGSSLYGAGTGGVVLLKNNAMNKNSNVSLSTTAGNYGLLSYAARAEANSTASSVRVQYSHLESDGYRKQTKLFRDAFQAQADFNLEKSSLSAFLLYSDLAYQTPGGLTLQQFDKDPSQARPAGGPNPGAVEQRAAIFNKSLFMGLNHRSEWNEHWSNETGVYGDFTNFKNPAIRNFENRSEQNFGGRTTTQYKFEQGKISFGGEYQHEFSPIRVYDNNQGSTGNLQYADEITTTTYFGFAQAEWFLPADFFLTTGASINKLSVGFHRFSTTPNVQEQRDFKTVFSPRIALLKKISPTLSTYISVSQGYSPPTIQELYPSAGIFDQRLNSERGASYEAGVRGNFFNKQLSVDVVGYLFNLSNTIVTRRTEDGAEYFANAGETSQKGIETKVQWSPALQEHSMVSALKIWVTYTNNNYTFKNYLKPTAASDSVDLSGNHLTGIAPHIVILGTDVQLQAGIYANVTFNFTDEIPLNDENTNYANGYALLGGKIGFKKSWQHLWLDVFQGIDNALNKTYSLGNDLNAVGGRYYNAAAKLNFYSGLKVGWTF